MNKRLRSIMKKIIPEAALRRLQRERRRSSITKVSRMPREPYVRGLYPMGINHIGPAQQGSGLGQAFRLVAAEIAEAGIPYRMYDYSPAMGTLSFPEREDGVSGNDGQSRENPSTPGTAGSQEGGSKSANERFCPYAVNLIEVNMHEFADAVLAMGQQALDGRYNIALWNWEVPDFPQEWIPLIDVVDEIWTPSTFTSDAMRRVTDKPVITMPYHVTVEPDESVDRDFFGLPEDRFLYLMMFDKGSVSERKNPKGVLEAFCKAFAADKDSKPANSTGQRKIPALVVRVQALDKADKRCIMKALEGYEVYFVEGNLSKARIDRLTQLCDVYVSLHRAEGFGLVLAEAMLMGTPVVATNYSANLEFETEEDTCLVDYRTVNVGRTVGLFRPSDTWAQPDTDDAARYMRRLYDDRKYYQNIRSAAQRAAQTKLGMNVPVRIIRERMARIAAQPQA